MSREKTILEHLKDKKFTKKDFLSAPKVLRTHCYILQPQKYDIICPICGSRNLDWSEFESHIWCYNCEKDVILIHRYAGIFGGPIPREVSAMFGIVFDRVNIKTKDVLVHEWKFTNEVEQNNFLKIYNTTWVKNKELMNYEKMLEEKLK